MGRLTLKVTLSFAQFEREVTGERIRDKIAAPKAKGMWRGGIPPFGYDLPAPGSRTLQVNDDDAGSCQSDGLSGRGRFCGWRAHQPRRAVPAAAQPEITPSQQGRRLGAPEASTDP